MKSPNRFLTLFLLATLLAGSVRAIEVALTGSDGLHIGTVVGDRVGLYGVTPVSQPTSSSQAALTDSTTGTAGTTLAAGVGVNTITVPLTSLATGLSTAAIDLLTTYTPGYKFKLLKLDFVTTVAGTGSSASQTFNLAIGSTATTGGSLNVTLSSTDTIGKITAASAISALNTGTSTDTISLKMAASGTVFTAGAGYFVIRIQNMDTADAAASITTLLNAIRSANVSVGVLKGS